jgi:hypothetical protein
MKEALPTPNRWRRFAIQSTIMLLALIVGYMSSMALKAYKQGEARAVPQGNAVPVEPAPR